MKLTIISYNRKAARKGLLLIYLGSASLLLNIIPYYFLNYFEILFVYFSSLLILSGILIEGYFTSKVNRIGYLIINEQLTQLAIGNTETELINAETKVAFSNTGYVGDYKPFLTLSSLRAGNGINTICFYSENKKLEYDILVESSVDFKKLKVLLDKLYKK